MDSNASKKLSLSLFNKWAQFQEKEPSDFDLEMSMYSKATHTLGHEGISRTQVNPLLVCYGVKIYKEPMNKHLLKLEYHLSTFEGVHYMGFDGVMSLCGKK